MPNSNLVHGSDRIVLLADGRALVEGGATDPDHGRNAETFDPLTNRWTVVGRMAVVRLYHTATTLDDGRVLVVGGSRGDEAGPPFPITDVPGIPTITPVPTADRPFGNETAELFDPVAGEFDPTGTLTLGNRFGHVAARLPDGRVLVAGGCRSRMACPLKSELYDPTTGRWQEAAALHGVRFYAAAAVLRDGRVLVVGGMDHFTAVVNEFTGQASAEVFDPATGQWTMTEPLGAPRMWGGAAVLDDGRVLVVGLVPTGDPERPDASAEIYDPRTNRWTATSPLTDRVSLNVTATVLPSGRVLVAGGRIGMASETEDVQLYDAESDRWTTGPPVPYPVSLVDLPGAVRLRNGAVLFGGHMWHALFLEAGLQLTDTPSPTATSADTLTPSATPSPTDTQAPTNTDTPTPTITSTPTITPTPTITSTPTITPPAYGFWTDTGPMNVPRVDHTATLLADGRVLVAGGTTELGWSWSTTSCTTSAEVYDPRTNTWRAVGSLHTPHRGHTAVRLLDGRVLVVGGRTAGEYPPAADIEVFDPATEQWTVVVEATPEPGQPQVDLATNAVVLPDGKVLLSGVSAGPYCGKWYGTTATTRTRILDPATWTIREGPPMRTARLLHFVASLHDGSVLLIGGVQTGYDENELGFCSIYYQYLAEVERYVPGEDRMVPVEPMPDGRGWSTPPRGHQAAVVLPNGDVVLDGVRGSMPEGSSTLVRYAPTTGKWTRIRASRISRRHGLLGVLPNGWLLAVGGWTAALYTAELYDPVEDRWLWARSPHREIADGDGTVSVLSDGRALVVGNLNGGDVAQVYTFTTPEAPRSAVFLPLAFG